MSSAEYISIIRNEDSLAKPTSWTYVPPHARILRNMPSLVRRLIIMNGQYRNRTRFMLHDEPKGIDVYHALRLFVALEYHALPGRLTQRRRRPSYATPLWDNMYC